MSKRSDVREAPFGVETFTGLAGEFHALDLLADARPVVVDCRAERPALVLGSRQTASLADPRECEAAGVDVVKRRSGGGVVLVEPGAMCWFDVVVPADDPRFASVALDVTASMWWLGSIVGAALEGLGVGGLHVHPGPMGSGPWAELVCFAGVGPGEVLDEAGRKVVGISQRRTRQGSRFQCMVHMSWNPVLLSRLLSRPRPEVSELEPVGTVSPEVADALPGAVARALSELVWKG